MGCNPAALSDKTFGTYSWQNALKEFNTAQRPIIAPNLTPFNDPARIKGIKLRIGLSGAGGCGKTTLAEFLAERFNLPLFPEGVREWLKIRKHKSPRHLSHRYQLALQKHFIKAKIIKESVSPAFVSDRTTIDAMALANIRGLTSIFPKNIERLNRRAFAHAASCYDLVIIPRLNMKAPFTEPAIRGNRCARITEEAAVLRLAKELGVTLYCPVASDIQTLKLKTMRYIQQILRNK
jgi:hypothetical protein